MNRLIHVVSGEMNDVWKLVLPKPEEQETEMCPPLHHHINNTCIPDFDCLASSDPDNDNSTRCTLDCDSLSTETSSNCLLECESSDESSSNSAQPNCVIEGDIRVNGSVDGTPTTVTIIGVINVTGDVAIIGQAILKLTSGATLHIDKCLVLDETAQIVAEVESGMMNGSVLLTFDSSCSSSSELARRVKIELRQSVEEMCRDGKPTVEEEEALGEGGMRRTHLTLVFVPMSESDECNVSERNELNVLAIAIAVPVAVLAVIVVVVMMSVPRFRMKLVPGSMKISASDKLTEVKSN